MRLKTMARQRTRQNTRGFLLIMGMFLTTAILMFTTVGLTRSLTELSSANRFVAKIQAFHLAEAGIDCAINQLRQNSNPALIPLACNGAGLPTVTLTPRAELNLFDVRSTGMVFSVPQSIVAVLRITSASSPFQQAMYGTMIGIPPGNPGIRLEASAFADSYDSSLGDYGFTNIAHNAEMRTTSNSSDAVRIIQGSELHGDTFTMNSTPPEYGVLVWLAVHDGTKNSAAPRTFPNAPVPQQPSGCTDLGVLSVPSGVVLVKTGTTYCATNLSITGELQFPNLVNLYVKEWTSVKGGGHLEVGQGTVTVRDTLYVRDPGSYVKTTSGPVDLYVNALSVTNHAQVMGPGLRPSNVRIFHASATPGIGPMSIWESQVWGLIYAPDVFVGISHPTSVTLSDAALFGAAIGTQSSLRAAALHYDEQVQSASFWPGWLGTTVELVAEYTPE